MIRLKSLVFFLFLTLINKVYCQAPDTIQAKRWFEKAEQLKDSASYDSSISYYEKAAAVFKEANLWDRYVQTCNETGESLRKKGDYNAAMTLLNQTLKTGLDKLGEQHPVVAANYHILGKVHSNKSNYEQALIFHNKALSIRLSILGEQHPDVASSYHSLGSVNSNKGDYKQALTLYNKALSIRLVALGEQHPDVASTYNNMGIIYYKKSNYDNAIAYFNKALSVWLVTLGKAHPHVALTYNNIGIIYDIHGDYDNAIVYYSKALSIRLAALGEQHSDVASSYNNLGSIYSIKGDYDRAFVFYNKALSIWLTTLGETHPYVAKAYHNIGNFYWYKRNYEQALIFYNRALSIKRITLGDQHSDVASTYYNIGHIYGEKGDYNQALISYRKALSINRAISEKQSPEVANNYNSIGLMCSETDSISQALMYYKKALFNYLGSIGEQHHDVAGTYSNIGLLYSAEGHNEQALIYHNKALDVYKTVLGAQHPDIARAYNYLGDHHSSQNHFNLALEFYQKAIYANTLYLHNPDPYANPSLDSVLSRSVLLESLARKARTLAARYSEKKQNLSDIKYALKTYELAIHLIDTLRNVYVNTKTKQELTARSLEIYEGAIRTTRQLYQITKKEKYLHQAFNFAEKSKSFLLLQALHEAEARQFSNVPDSLIQREKDLKIDLTFYEQQLYEAKQKNDAAKIIMYQDYRFEKKMRYDSLIKRLERHYPEYHDLKYKNTVASSSEIQQYLPDDTALLEYFMGDNAVYAFLITSQKIYLKQLPEKGQIIRQHLNNFRKHFDPEKTDYFLLAGQEDKQRLFEDYARQSHTLFKILVEPILSNLSTDPALSRLIIVPDGVLGYLPFEALTTKKPIAGTSDFSRLPYFIHQWKTAYAYSATLWVENFKNLQNREKRMDYTKPFAGFAPEYAVDSLAIASLDTASYQPAALLVRNGSLPLAHTQQEVNSIATLLDGDVFLAQEATKKMFREKASEYQVLHLAMHAVTNDKNPLFSRLLFNQDTDTTENDHMSAMELYNLDIAARLAVLSACETGYGTIARGEGVMSLSRAFAYAGCPSLVMSLWKVPDQATSKIMIDFYTILKKNKTIDVSLREAKLQYLFSTGNPYYSHPFFWAGFVPVGDMEPLELQEDRFWNYWTILVFLMAAGAGWYLKTRWLERRKIQRN